MKLVSIMGDSISTYAGYNPKGYAVFYDADAQARNGMNSVYDTWWAKVNQVLGAKLCVNGSFSGSRVTGGGFPAACSAQRIAALQRGGYVPDRILIYMGINDFGNGVMPRRKGMERFCCPASPLVFADAYAQMLTGLHRQYPQAEIVCGTLLRTEVRNHPGWAFPESYAGMPLEEYNRAIRRVCKRQRCHLADVGAADIRCETLDGTHPTAKGHTVLFERWIKYL